MKVLNAEETFSQKLDLLNLCFDGRYGGGPTLPRMTINSGLSQADLSIEVYPLRLHLLLTPKSEQAIIRISKKVLNSILSFCLLAIETTMFQPLDFDIQFRYLMLLSCSYGLKLI